MAEVVVTAIHNLTDETITIPHQEKGPWRSSPEKRWTARSSTGTTPRSRARFLPQIKWFVDSEASFAFPERP